MGHTSSPDFLTLHALRIKGFAKPDVLAEIAGLPEDEVVTHLSAFRDSGHTLFREQRSLWQLTPDGKAYHAQRLADDVEASGAAHLVAESYEQFLGLNVRFKELCGDWQLRDGAPNDHSDEQYDRAVVARLDGLNTELQPVVTAIGEAFVRFGPYAPRLDAVCRRVVAGETNMFTGVMCGSYHDVWMELHEDLILTQGIDRAAEGSF
jgi:hypothetical protein